jgi:fructose-1,6-bisphosphatase-3
VKDLIHAFTHSVRLRQHVDFLYSHGSMYKCVNGNLLYNGCIPLEEDGTFERVSFWEEPVQGRAFLDKVDLEVRKAWSAPDQDSVDFLWYLWCGSKSPLFGKVIKTFERTYLEDKDTWKEPRNPYYVFNREKRTAKMILHEFGLYSERSHIINGHTPVNVKKGESPIRADGKLYVIDGGFCKAYQKATGIAGYTLIFNSHGMKLKTHQPFTSLKKALEENVDIHSDTEIVEEEEERIMVADTDDGVIIRERIKDLKALLKAYRSGLIRER